MFIRLRFVILILLLTMCLPSVLFSQDTEEPSIITIEHALKTTYMQDEEKGTDAIRFEGDVQVSVEKGKSKTTIFSDYVDFDRKRNSLYAEGSVTMEQSSNGEVTERLTAESLLFDTISLEGFFNVGRVVQEQQESLNLSDGSVLIVSSELFAKGSSNSVTFKNGNLTFCDDEHPHWEINASRIWLLPGNEFAFANALLYVGPVPVMYFPFFYYPKDELVFNPAFGFRSREGFFIQTSTYLIGRKPLSGSDSDDEENDIGFNFMQQNQLKEQELQGLILRNLDENATMPNDYLKILADYYSTLGGMIGIAGSFEPNNIITEINFDARLGFSNVVFKLDDYPLYVSYADDQKYNDYGWFFGQKVPFRYGVEFESDIRVENLSISFDIPFYSDPWFNSDFGDRQESMDWIDFFLSGALVAPADEEDDDSDNGITGFTWDINASYKPTFPALTPWISSISLSSLNSSVVFATQNAPSSDFENTMIQDNSPNREFFYPSQIKPLSAKVSIAGTLFEWPNKNTTESATTTTNDITLTDEQKSIVENLVIPEDLKTEDLQTEDEDSEKELLLDEDSLPSIEVTEISSSEVQSSSYKLSYTIAPEISSLFSYSSTKPLRNDAISPSDFDIADPKSGEMVVKSPLTVTSGLQVLSSLLSLTNTINFSPEYQDHHTLSDDYYTESEKDSIILDDYKNFQLDVKNTNKLSIKPFQSSTMFKNTSLNWNTAVNIIRTEFSGTVEDPNWDYKTPEWDSDVITTHNINAAFEATQSDFYQRLTLETNLPPLVDQYSGTLTFGFPFGNVVGSSGYKRENEDSTDWLFLPFKQSATLTFFEKTIDGDTNDNKITVRQSYEYDIEEETSDTLSLSLAWRGLQLSYNMRDEYNYSLDLDNGNGWVASADKTFSPYSLALSWNVSNFEYKNEDETVEFKPGIATSLSWDMVIPTRSYFSFKPSLSLEIKDFLTVTFSSESRNDQLVTYVQDAIGFTPEIPGEKNIFIDLINSFNFFDDTKRQSSGFKIESFNVAIEHDLHDWTLTSEFEIEPKIITDTDGSKSFDYSPYFTLSILWKPMAGIKTTIEDDYGEFTLNP